MGFILGSSCFLQSPLFQSFSSSSSSIPWLSSQRNVAKTKLSTVASLPHENTRDGANLPVQKRAVLLLGLSAFPFWRFGALAASGLVQEKQDINTVEVQDSQKLDNRQETLIPEKNQNESHVQTQEAAGNPFLSLLNELGIIGIGVIGALYANSRKNNATMQSTIESMRTMLDDMERCRALLEKNFESRLLNEKEEHKKQLRKLKEEEASLSNQLASANGTVASLQNDLHIEKRFVEGLKLQISQLQSSVIQASEDKKMLEAKLEEKIDTVEILQDRVSLLSLEIRDKEKTIETLNLALAGKESECENLNSIISQSRAELEATNSAVKQLEKEAIETRKELDLKKSVLDESNEKIKSLLAEKDANDKKIHALQEDYNDLKLSSEEKTATDSKLLSKKEYELHQLEEKLARALDEARSDQVLIANLTKDRDSVVAMLEEEVNKVKKLRNEVERTQATLEASKHETSDLLVQLLESKKLCEYLKSEISRIHAESSEAQTLLNKSLEKVKSTSKLLSEELISAQDALKRTNEELLVMSDELKAAVEARKSLKKELLEIYKKAETSANDLKDERKVVAALNRDLEASRKQILKDSEARKTLERDLDEATRSLDEMNKRALSLSRELENANSRTASLEAEKECLCKSLVEQKNLAKEAQENIEDAQDLIMRLGLERESSEKRARKLEEELASAKGEILRMRMSRGSVNGQNKKTNQVEAAASVVAKKNGGRRRKAGPTSEAPQ